MVVRQAVGADIDETTQTFLFDISENVVANTTFDITIQVAQRDKVLIGTSSGDETFSITIEPGGRIRTFL